MFDLKGYLQIQRQKVDIALAGYVDTICHQGRLHDPVRYTLLSNGKRLRPILCLAACALVGGQEEQSLPAACALEMIHAYSLIHDDLPALDNDDLRRGRPTCHVAFNEATAILAGDTLLTLAFEVLSLSGSNISEDQAGRYLRAIKIIAEAAGCNGMIEGQARDLAFEGMAINQDELQEIHTLKTGALISAAVASGAVLGQGSDDQLKHLTDYAQKIGLAFQVADDILNVMSTPEQLGKAVGTDQAHRKNTYPALLGLEPAQQYARTLIDDALQALTFFDNKAEPLRALARYIIERRR
jgi:geranylgeranyl diphosphate synthase type II